jgi:hypothetical protein
MGVVYERYFPTSYTINTVDIVTWNKYNCDSNTTYTYEYPERTNHTSESTFNYVKNWGKTTTVYTGYNYTSTEGLTLTGETTKSVEELEGYYDGGMWETMVYQYGEITDTGKNSSTGYDYITYQLLELASSKISKTTYSKGSTSYGSITSSTGSLPENGTLIEGSAYGDYCIITIDGADYYYEKAS